MEDKKEEGLEESENILPETSLTNALAITESITRDLESLHDNHLVINILNLLNDHFRRSIIASNLRELEDPRLHELQQRILVLAKDKDIHKMSLREIGAEIGVGHPQKVKYHLNQLKGKGLI